MAFSEDLFTPIKTHLGGEVLPWPNRYEGLSLSEFVDELITINEELLRSSHLVGFCFGGVVALEISRRIRPKSLVVINAPGDSYDITEDFRKAVHFGLKMPEALIKPLLKSKGPNFFIEKDNLTEDCGKMVESILNQVDFEFLRWAARVSTSWDCPEPPELETPSLFLNGEFDRIVPKPKRREFETMDETGHLIPLTHPEALAIKLQQFWKNIPS